MDNRNYVTEAQTKFDSLSDSELLKRASEMLSRATEVVVETNKSGVVAWQAENAHLIVEISKRFAARTKA